MTLRRKIYRTVVIPWLLFFTPTATKATECSVQSRIIEDLILRGDFERATDRLVEIEFYCEVLEVRLAAAALQARLYESADKNITSIRLLQRFLDREKQIPFSLREGILLEQSRLYLLENNLLAATANWPKTYPNLLKKVSRQYDLIHEENSAPLYYAIASAVPGLGQILQKEYSSAFTSVLMIAIPAYYGHLAKMNNEHALASTMSFLAGFFYLGNIASSYRVASISQRRLNRDKWTKDLQGTLVPLFIQRTKSLGLSLQVEIALK